MGRGRHRLDGDTFVRGGHDIISRLVDFERHLATGDHGSVELANTTREVTQFGGSHSPVQLLLEPGECLGKRLDDLNLG